MAGFDIDWDRKIEFDGKASEEVATAAHHGKTFLVISAHVRFKSSQVFHT